MIHQRELRNQLKVDQVKSRIPAASYFLKPHDALHFESKDEPESCGLNQQQLKTTVTISGKNTVFKTANATTGNTNIRQNFECRQIQNASKCSWPLVMRSLQTPANDLQITNNRQKTCCRLLYNIAPEWSLRLNITTLLSPPVELNHIGFLTNVFLTQQRPIYMTMVFHLFLRYVAHESLLAPELQSCVGSKRRCAPAEDFSQIIIVMNKCRTYFSSVYELIFLQTRVRSVKTVAHRVIAI